MHYTAQSTICYSRWELDRSAAYKLDLSSLLPTTILQKTGLPFEIAIQKHLLQVRKKFPYLRFWFSGGKDSRIILDEAIRSNVFFDELVILKPMIFGNLLVGTALESHIQAIPIALEYQKLFPKTKIHILELSDKHYNYIYSNVEQWWREVPHYFFVNPHFPNQFYKHINPQFSLLPNISESIDLFGFVDPHVWYYDGQWRASYTDLDFNCIWPTVHHFISEELLASFLEEVTVKFESMGHYPTKFNNTISGRTMKNLTKTYSNIRLNGICIPKVAKIPNYPKTEKFWSSVDGTKDIMLNLLAQYYPTPIKSWENWAYKSNWDEIISDINSHGILSDEYVLHQ